MPLSSRAWAIVLTAFVSSVLLVMAAKAHPPTEGHPEPSDITPVAALETKRFMVESALVSPADPRGAVSFSPDRNTYLVRLIQGDVERGGVWMEIVVGVADSLEGTLEHRVITRLFSTGLGAGEGRAGANLDSLNDQARLRWIDENYVTFLWSDENSVRQVTRVNVRNGQSEALTAHPTSVLTYDVGQDGTVIYCALPADTTDDSARLLRAGFAIDESTDALSLIQGRPNAGSIVDRLLSAECFLQRPAEVARKVSIAHRPAAPTHNQELVLAPRSDCVLARTNAPVIPREWEEYEHPRFRARVIESRLHPHGPIARSIYQYWLLDTSSGESRALWDAPAAEGQAVAAWSPEGDELLLAPTFLPLSDPDPRGRRGIAAAVVDRQTGSYQTLPLYLHAQTFVRAKWLASHRIELQLRVGQEFERLEFERSEGDWHLRSRRAERPRIKITLRDDLDTPPALVAVDTASGRIRLALDPNPRLSQRLRIGKAEVIGGDLPNGIGWSGVLLYPPDYRKGDRYPLVIQSVYGEPISDEFTLYGTQGGYGLGPPVVSPYAGRSLAAMGFLVLQVNIRGDAKLRTPAEPEIRRELFESAARQLIKSGLASEAQIGLIGFSRNGYYVEYTLAHSTFPFAAAVAADHFDASYVAQTLLGYDAGGAAVNGGLPFGDELQSWIEHAPGFRAEHIKAPLMRIEQSRGLLGAVLKWELHSRLRYLKKPVELYVVPNASQGVHNTQNPEQILAVQSRVIDWCRFWLLGIEDPDASKVAQYVRWRALRVARDAGLKSDALE